MSEARHSDERAPEPAGSTAGAALDAAAPEPGGSLALGRRRWLQAAAGVLGGSVALAFARRRTAPAPPPAAAAAAMASVPEARAPRFQPQLFSREQALLVEDLAEHILPEGDSPGALSAGVPAYIEDIVREVYDEPERRAFLRALDASDAEARAAHGHGVLASSAEQRQALLARGLESCAPSFDTGEPWCFFQAFRALTIEGFCQSRLGATRVLQYESVPGEYRGCVPLTEVGRAWATS